MTRTRVGILLFDGVEVLDFAGPFEVFSRTRLVPGVESRRSDDSAPFEVFTVAATTAPVVATGGLRVVPHHALGALLLARIRLLAGRRATTHWGALDHLAALDSSIRVERDLRVVKDGVMTSAGVSAGIDLAFELVAELCGEAVADETARYIEYPRG